MSKSSTNKFVIFFARVKKKLIKSKTHHDFTLALEDKDGRNISITIIVDHNTDSFSELNQFIRFKRSQNRKIKYGYIVNLLHIKSITKPVYIMKYIN